MQVSDWRPPWPPMRISEAEWVIIRDSKREPAAVVRRLQTLADGVWWRVVGFAPRSEDRTLIGYLRSLELADRLVKFAPPQLGLRQ